MRLSKPDVPNRKIELLLPENEIQRRLAERPAPEPVYERGYGKLFLDQVTQAHEGCDFRFLRKVDKDGAAKRSRP